MRVLVTGGAGFIGSALVRMLIDETDVEVVNLDKLTYAGSLASVASVASNSRYKFVRGDICDRPAMTDLFETVRPDAVMHLAAESHVDRSIDGPGTFIATNVVGTYTLLEVARAYWSTLTGSRRENFRFHHVSTDEVFGSLGQDGHFTEASPYSPNSPYSASKASSDHLVRAWHHTYGLPIIITNSSNNYGPYQFPEKLIPLMILNGLEEKPLPVYGVGENIRDWLYVDDHVQALWAAVTRGKPGTTYNIGGEAELRNIDVVQHICNVLDELVPASIPRRELIVFVADRPGHDVRYAMDISRIRAELAWEPSETFETALHKTVTWYLDNAQWCRDIRRERYSGERLGLISPQATA